MKLAKIYSPLAIFVMLVCCMASCGKEEPFPNKENGFGSLSTAKLFINLDPGENTKTTRPQRNANPADFTIDILKADGTILESFLYAEMPAVIELPVGEYIAKAYLGDPSLSAFDAPYYEGASEKFSIVKDEITEVQTIECKFANVKVSILYSADLIKAMAEDAGVKAQLTHNALDFLRDETRSGYFAHTPGNSTLVATFHGKVNGVEETTSKVYTEVAPGVHYRIKYTLHNPGEDPDASGNIIPGLTVDASVDIVDFNYNITWDDDTIPDDPKGGDDPDDPKNDGPTLSLDSPLSFDKTNEVGPSSTVIVKVASSTGITTFTVDIDSPTLTKDELTAVGLDSHLDLVNPGNLEEAIAGLGLPVNVGGKMEVTFDISSFMPLLAVLGEGNHSFIMTVSDSTGTTKKTLKLHMNP